MRLLGIDPGISGALALLEDGNLLSVHDMPVASIRRGRTDKNEVEGNWLRNLITELGWIDVCVLEQVGGFARKKGSSESGQSASAAFNFGRSCGIAEGVVKGLSIRVVQVSPMKWHSWVSHRGGKDESRAIASRLWPASAQDFVRKKDADRAEAALMAFGWWRTFGVNEKGSGDVFG